MELANYLIFNGNCREAFKHYENLLGGRIEFTITYGEGPAGEHKPPPEMADRIMHVRMRVDGQALMGSDAHADYEKPQGNWVSLSVDSTADAERIYKGLADGANVIMPLQKTFLAEKFGMLIDRFGTPWMVNCEAKSK